ncbi:MAG TPA: IniB N-terminal domain-containing protein [Rugosimonospora sp.]|nr:IniB N-terminal domain-containing protein [Rugosimonospora sp.]
MESPQTLHDFVLNLLNNADARAAFQLDPQGALHDAGLSDIDAADVRDVVPLVVDYAPATVGPVLDGTLSQLSTGVTGGGTASAIQQLQLVTQQLPPSVLNTTPLSTTVAATGLTGLSGSLHGTGAAMSGSMGLSGDFSAAHDVTHTLDAGAVSDATNTVTSVTGQATAQLDGTAGQLTAPVSGIVPGTPDLSHPLGTVTSTLDGATHDLTGSLSQVLGGNSDLLHLSGGGLSMSGSAATTGSVGTAMHADSSTSVTGHADNPLAHGIVGDLLGGTPLAGAEPDGHLLDVSHLF